MTDPFPLLRKWRSVAEIRDYYRRAVANLRDIAQEEKQTILDEEESVVTAYKDERRQARLLRERDRREVAA